MIKGLEYMLCSEILREIFLILRGSSTPASSYSVRTSMKTDSMVQWSSDSQEKQLEGGTSNLKF